MLLQGKPVAQFLDVQTKAYIDYASLQWKKAVFFLLNDDKPSEVYVWLKMNQAKHLGLAGVRVHQPTIEKNTLLKQIKEYNDDDSVVGIMVQLPLPDHLQKNYAEIVATIAPHKDFDGLGGRLLGLSSIELIDFLPATPKAVFALLDYYDFGDFKGKTIALFWQSNLIGKPLALESMKRWATVVSFNGSSDQEWVISAVNHADLIISATGVLHLFDQRLYEQCSWREKKILIDVGRGIKDGRAAGDIDWEFYQDKVKAVTPVPGGIGPVTVASIFHNIKVLGEQADLLV